jgi:Raf kinase inhibitor-like YbhB/YbcL family protein
VYTCTGGGESPEISWANIPQGTQMLVLVLDDPDAPKGTFTHWIVFNIPRGASGIPRAQTAVKEIATGGQQGTNSAGDRLYFPPCPPPGPQHRYIFRLYALDYTPGLPTADREGIETAMSGHVIGQTQVQTTFGRG